MTIPGGGPNPAAPAARLLAAVEAHYQSLGVALPARRYLLAGNAAGAAWDDEHVSVSLNAVQPGPSPASQRTALAPHQVGVVMPRGVYEIRILRCWPTVDDDGDPPPAEDINAAAVTLMRDAGLILGALHAYAAADDTAGIMTVGEVQPLGPLGGLAGYACVITLSPMV